MVPGNQRSPDFSSSNPSSTNYSWLPQMVNPPRTGQRPAIKFLFLCLVMETQILPIGLAHLFPEPGFALCCLDCHF